MSSYSSCGVTAKKKPQQQQQKKMSLTHKVLVCLNGRCVFLLIEPAAVRRGVGDGGSGNWGPLRGHHRPYKCGLFKASVRVLVYVGAWKGHGGVQTADLSSGCARTVCVFIEVSHLAQFLEKPNTVCASRCWQMCGARRHNLRCNLKQETQTHGREEEGRESNTWPLLQPSSGDSFSWLTQSTRQTPQLLPRSGPGPSLWTTALLQMFYK